MQRNSYLRTTKTGLLLASCCSLFVSYRSVAVAREDVSAPAPAPESGSVENETRWWNTYVEDIVTTMRMDGASGRMAEIPPRVVYAPTERMIDSTGRWRSVTLTYSMSRAVEGSGSQMDASADTVRIEDDGDGSPPRLSNTRGECLKLPIETSQVLGSGPVSWLGMAMLQTVSAASRLILAAAPRFTFKGRDWVDRAILTDDRLEARRASLLKALGEPQRTPTGKWVFRTVKGSRSTEQTIDTTIYAPIAIEVRANERVEDRTTIEYARAADGSVVRKRMLLERPAARRGMLGMRTEIAISNVHLEKRNPESFVSVRCRDRR